MIIKKFFILITACYLLAANLALAQVPTLSKVRVTYRPDGGVSITSFVAGACQGGETETECMDREMQKNPALADLPHDDIYPSELPQDRKDRNKWTGSKEKGVWIDYSKVTKEEKRKELENLLDIAINSSDTIQVAKLQRLIQKLGQYNTPYGLIPLEDISKFNVDAPLTLGAIEPRLKVELPKQTFFQKLLNWLIFWR